MNLENKYQLIDDYLNRSMGQDDIDKFKAFMQSDADLTADVKILGEMDEMSGFFAKEQDLRDSLAQIRSQDQSSSSNMRIRNIALLAASFILLIGLFLFNPFQSKDSGAQIIQQYASVEPLELTTKSETSFADLREMQDLYNQGEYKASLSYIDKYLQHNPKDLDVLLAKGISLYQIQDFKAAQATFSKIESYKPRVLKYKWYSAIAFLKEGNELKAKQILNDIVAAESFNHEQASKILTTFQ